MKIKNKKIPAKVIVLTLVIVVLILVAGAVMFLKNEETVSRQVSPDTELQDQSSINYGPPTDEEKKTGDEQKQSVPGATDPKPENTGTADVVIVDAGQYDNAIEVRSFVSNVVQDGKCTIVFTQGSLTVTKEVAATADASSTICKALVMPRSELPKSGKWNINVKFVSPSNSGEKSSTIDVE